MIVRLESPSFSNPSEELRGYVGENDFGGVSWIWIKIEEEVEGTYRPPPHSSKAHQRHYPNPYPVNL